MRPQEFYLLWEARRPREPEETLAGRLTSSDCDRLLEAMEDPESIAEE